jgi:tripartite-type tricarboxylate transporter receptor subunit TctC
MMQVRGTMKFAWRELPHLVALKILLTLALLPPTGHTAAAQWAPGKTAKFVVPFPPGGATDTIARLLAPQISQSTGQAIIIENRPGAGTVIATEATAKSAPDGTTLLFMANSFIINPNLRPNLAYDPLTSFEPACLLVGSPAIIAVNGTSPFRSLQEFVAAARGRPGELTYGATGPGAAQHIAGEMFKRAANINLTYVPYPGGAPAMTALLGGHITAFIGNYSEVMEQLSSSKIRALAVMAHERHVAMENVPTMAESGYRDIESTAWFGMVAPAKTPASALNQIITSLKLALNVPEIKSKLVLQGLYPIGICGAEFGAYLQRQHQMYARILREGNIKAE